MVRLKQAHPHWGPRKFQALYQRQHGGEVPSESSFKRVLERAGLTVLRRVRRVTETGRLGQGRKGTATNDVWRVDFKGWWRDREGLRVEPLTVRDEHSRMLLEMQVLANSQTATVRACFERLFERYGMF
jgi:putative transposase